ncbi:unnamed protein product [Mesocestoides corti]|uniref:Integrin_alpha2 domain-containing protein n=1 Tax=Mesocestoides corti TaxID=53468 RepID=A0A0R3U3F7_MESCO|nr:unnamed protein product [Mesocestoides corti]
MCSKSILLYIITSLLAQRSTADPKHLLETKSRVDLEEERDALTARLWNPQTSLKNLYDHRITRHYPLPQFNLEALASSRRTFDENFSWTSVTLLSLPQYNLSYVLLGGSWARHKDSPYPREDGIVQLCNFTLSSTDQLTFTSPCQDLSEGLKSAAFLGAASASLKISPNMGLLVYCDPLWRDQSYFPAGRCYLQLLHNANLRARLELSSFCRTGGHVTEPCMTGFSVDLLSKGRINSSFVDILKGIHVVVGQPLAPAFGRVQILADPFYSPRVYTVYRPEILEDSLPESYFGYSVAGDYVSVVSDGFAQLSDASNKSDLAQLFKIGSLDGIRTAGAIDIDWQGLVDSAGSFCGFGTSMVHLKNVDGQDMIVVGAPYAAKGGRVYLYCVPTNFALNGREKLGMPTDSYRDFVSAPQGSGAFGYALSVVGDLDGDGFDDIAVGAPQLRDRTKSGRVYLLRVLPNCTFDRRPIQVIDGPESGAYFGSVLPREGTDMDFNGWPDFVLPVPLCTSCVPMIYASRPRYQAVCRFHQPNWLGSVRLRRNVRIPIKLKVRLIPLRKNGQRNLAELLEAAGVTPEDLLHQVIPDLWAKDPSEQRVRLSAFHSMTLNPFYNMLTLKFDLLPQMDVEDMPSLEQPSGAVRVQYRFSVPCSTDSAPSGGSTTCQNDSWIHRPIIDWSDCSFQLRLTKFVCLPRGKCESDLSLRVTDEKAGRVVTSSNSNSTGQTVLIYGDKEGAMSKLTVDVFNNGPTFAGGVWINFVFHGNLRFSAFEQARNGTVDFVGSVCSHPLNNDTWVACKLGRLDPPLTNSSVPIQRIRLTSFYVLGEDSASVDYSADSYVNISVLSQTYDPIPLDNSVVWRYLMLHAPRYLITTGARAPPSVVDNRTRPTPWSLDFHHRMRVEEMGPRLQHTFQIEHMGPSKRLVNVTVRLQVPVELAKTADHLVYLFNEVRSPMRNGAEMEWVSLRPSVKLLGGPKVEDVLTGCSYANESLINPNRWIGIDMSNPRLQRSRRAASDFPDPAEDALWPIDHNATDPLGETAATRRGGNRPQKVIFRRVPKEVFLKFGYFFL